MQNPTDNQPPKKYSLDDVSTLFQKTVEEVKNMNDEQVLGTMMEVRHKIDGLSAEMADCVMLRTLLELRIACDNAARPSAPVSPVEENKETPNAE